MIVTKKITYFNQDLALTNERAIYWEKYNSLILSDLHIGKSAHFQKSGIAIPSSILAKDLARLANLIHHFRVTQLIIVGDLFHAEYNKDLDEFSEWLLEFNNLKLKLIKGNHDRLKKSVYQFFNIEVFQPNLQIEELNFVHDFVKPNPDFFTISGHTHPGVSIKTKGKQRIKLPCYQVSKQQLILPAFSLFTGLNTKDCPKDCINYCFTDDGIFEV